MSEKDGVESYYRKFIALSSRLKTQEMNKHEQMHRFRSGLTPRLQEATQCDPTNSMKRYTDFEKMARCAIANGKSAVVQKEVKALAKQPGSDPAKGYGKNGRNRKGNNGDNRPFNKKRNREERSGGGQGPQARSPLTKRMWHAITAVARATSHVTAPLPALVTVLG